MSLDNSSKEKVEEKIGEALGLEMAAQKAVQELSSKGLQKLSGTLDSVKIQETAQETEQKASEMMKTYLGEDPDSSEAIEFLCLAEGGEVTHLKF